MMDVLLGIVDRGWVAESHHRGRISVVREDGRVLLSLGDMTVPTLPRSALKPFQAIGCCAATWTSRINCSHWPRLRISGSPYTRKGRYASSR